MKEKNSSMWLKTENKFSIVPGSTKILSVLPKGIYNLIQDPMTKQFELERLYDSFEFPFKIYGLEDKFINHVIKTYENTTSNLGILLHGVKGTGKTVSAKIISQRMNLPVIIVSKPYEGLADYLASIESECIFFFDEFEKNFAGSEHNGLLLSVMDGVYNTNTRKIFILTTNSININENFLSRPSRIRYKKSFGNLPLLTVKEYLNENLEDKKQSEDVVEYVNTLANSTIDILKCIVDELNLHKCPVDDIKGFMNLQTAKHYYNSVYTGSCSTKEEFMRLLERAENAVINKELDENGDPYQEIWNYPELWDHRFSTNVNIRLMSHGEIVDYCEIVEPIDSNGIMVVSYYGEKRFYKVFNVDTRPNLYNLTV